MAVGSKLDGFYEPFPYLPLESEWPIFFSQNFGVGDEYAITINSEVALPKGTEINIYARGSWAIDSFDYNVYAAENSRGLLKGRKRGLRQKTTSIPLN